MADVLGPAAPGVPVRIVHRKGPDALIEWLDGDEVRRATVPAAEISSESTHPDPGSGAPYGLDWESLVVFEATPARLARELRRRGIWTLDDLRARPNDAIGALQTVYGLDFTALVRAAERAHPD